MHHIIMQCFKIAWPVVEQLDNIHFTAGMARLDNVDIRKNVLGLNSLHWFVGLVVMQKTDFLYFLLLTYINE